MPAWSNVLGNQTIGREEPLRMPWRRTTLPASFPLAGGLVRVFGAMIEVPGLSVCHGGYYLPRGGPVACEPVRNHHAGYICSLLEELAEQLLCRRLVALTLHQDIEPVAILIARPPPRVPFAMDTAKDVVAMPRIARRRSPAPELIGLRLPTLAAPLPNRFVGHCHAACKQELFHIARVEAEPAIQPDRVAEDLSREAVVCVRVDWGGGVHRRLRMVDRYQERASSHEELWLRDEYATLG